MGLLCISAQYIRFLTIIILLETFMNLFCNFFSKGSTVRQNNVTHCVKKKYCLLNVYHRDSILLVSHYFFLKVAMKRKFQKSFSKLQSFKTAS